MLYTMIYDQTLEKNLYVGIYSRRVGKIKRTNLDSRTLIVTILKLMTKKTMPKEVNTNKYGLSKLH